MPLVRSIFISDIHLGTRACQAEQLLDFLREHSAEHLFLVGDIVDFWAMSRGINWTPAQNTVVQKVLRRARHGERVVLIPGNHDEALREYDGTSFGGIRVACEYVHTLADGRRFLVTHGDEFDQVTRYHRWVAVLGDVAYNLLVRQAQGEDRGQLHFRFRGFRDPRRPRARPRRRRLRPHPQRRGARGRRRLLRQLRRLGR